jgi:hypothetical protein
VWLLGWVDKINEKLKLKVSDDFNHILLDEWRPN